MARQKKYGTGGRSGPAIAVGVVSEKDTGEVWPGPDTNVEQFTDEYSILADNKQFHVDYLLDTFRDFARPNMYKIEFVYGIDIEKKFSFMSSESKTMTEMTARTVNLPAFDIGKQEVKRCGERFFIPTNQNYGDLQMTLICDDDFTQRKFLHSWIKHIVYDTDYNYYHKLRRMLDCKVIVKQLDNKFNVIFAAEFGGAWPFSIGEIQLSQDSDSQLVDFPATFCYSSYRILSNTMD